MFAGLSDIQVWAKNIFRWKQADQLTNDHAALFELIPFFPSDPSL